MHNYKHISKPQTFILNIVKEMFPGQKIHEEWHLGDGLRLDIFLPDLGLGIEYHGEQHFKFIPYFHGTREKFLAAQERDLIKLEKCEELGIVCIVFSCNVKLTKEFVWDKIKEGLGQEQNYNPHVWKEIDTFKNRQRDLYQAAKDYKKASQEKWEAENEEQIKKRKEKQKEEAREYRKRQYEAYKIARKGFKKW